MNWLKPLVCFAAAPSLLWGQAELWPSGFRHGSFVVPSRPVVPFIGAPYCADEVSEFRQTGTDGTHFSRTVSVVRECRDSAGRTRAELLSSDPIPRFKLAEMIDPVAGYLYVLDLQNKIAHRAKLPTTSPIRKPHPPRTAGTSDAAQSRQRPTSSFESLGTKTLDGIQVEGTLLKEVYPINLRGNDRPVTETYERWDSQELNVTVWSKRSDPISGDQITRLDNLTTVEPDPGLFKVPDGYRIVDETSRVISIKARQ